MAENPGLQVAWSMGSLASNRFSPCHVNQVTTGLTATVSEMMDTVSTIPILL